MLDLLRLRFAREDCARLAKLASLARNMLDLLDLLRLRFAREDCARLAKLASLARNMLDLQILGKFSEKRRIPIRRFTFSMIFRKTSYLRGF